jgi:hypothetical protein
MVIHKMWRVERKSKFNYRVEEYWDREGWFLFGFIPLYVKTTRHTLIV